jgi:hypothetical protein
MTAMQTVSRISAGKSEGKRPLVKHREKWEDNIRNDIIERGSKDADWIPLPQIRFAFVNTVLNP